MRGENRAAHRVLAAPAEPKAAAGVDGAFGGSSCATTWRQTSAIA
jgi:hypothetical protein